ncbi:MAG: ice-binding family protein [bacterium]
MKKFNKIAIVILAIAFTFGFTGLSGAATAISLGTADNFAVLAGTGITFGGAVNTTNITGDIGTYSITTITGIGNVVLNGTNHAGDSVTQGAKTDLTTAYLNAEGQTSLPLTTLTASDTNSFNVTGTTLTPGWYAPLSSDIFFHINQPLTARA